MCSRMARFIIQVQAWRKPRGAAQGNGWTGKFSDCDVLRFVGRSAPISGAKMNGQKRMNTL